VRVLVVEDEPSNRETLCDVLRFLGHTPYGADSAAQALALVSQAKPQVIVSDLNLPDMDGRELIKRILSQCSDHLYSVALSGYYGEAERELALRAGFDSFLLKPVTLETVRATIESIPR
jgi:CheY-like chemotaxis protein